jgi:hypothetical protein
MVFFFGGVFDQIRSMVATLPDSTFALTMNQIDCLHQSPYARIEPGPLYPSGHVDSNSTARVDIALMM